MPQHQLLVTDILIDTLLRTTFAQGLRWRSPGAGFEVTREEDVESIRDAVRFDDAGSWLELQAEATGHASDVPEVRVRVTVPADSLTGQEALAAANEVNRHALAPVHYDAALQALVVRHSIAFTGFHDTPSVLVDPAFTIAQREATMNMLAATFATVHECLRAVSPTGADEPRQLRVDKTPVDKLDAFTVFVLSRLYRWGLVKLQEDGPALSFLRDAAASCLVVDARKQGTDPAPAQQPQLDAAAQARVAGWMRNRLFLDPADDPYLDAVLLEVDQQARARLQEVMADPPNTRPLRQLRLLEAALAARPQHWAGAQMAEGNLRVALAMGLDLEIANVPEAFANRLSERYPFLAPPAGAKSVVLPQTFWLTAS